MPISARGTPSEKSWATEMRQISHSSYRRVGLLLLLALASCVRQSPSDLTLRNVFLSDWSSQFNEWHGGPNISAQAIVLRLTSVDPIAPRAPLILQGHCDGTLQISGWDLYVPADRDLSDRLDQPVDLATPENPYEFYILIPVWRTRGPFSPESAEYNLERDDRDICLRTKMMREDYVWDESNVIRVPRRLIDQALRAGLKPLPAMKRI